MADIKIPETMFPVESSSVKAIGYYDDDIYVEFKSGLYKYKNAGVKVFVDLMRAPSIGRFVNEVLKPNYDYDYIR